MKRLITYFFTFTVAYYTAAQGCSDAGFCTAGNMKPLVYKNDSVKSNLNFSLNYSIGERGIIYIIPQFEPIVKVTERSFVQIKIPYVFISGNLGSTKGIGDVILNYNYLMDSVIKYRFSITAGLKIAAGSSSVKSEGICLPMPYQPSMGTTDFFAGIKLDFKYGLSFAAGLQMPMSNLNQNSFDSAAFLYFKSQRNIDDSKNYFISSNLKRKSDLMLRIDKIFKFKKTNFQVGFLPIYHVGKDKVNVSAFKQINDDGSQGLTLNLNSNLSYKISKKTEINITSAMPVITRKSRPDGLTRKVIALASFRYEL